MKGNIENDISEVLQELAINYEEKEAIENKVIKNFL